MHTTPLALQTSMALPLLHYLTVTAQDSALKGYFETMELITTAQYDPEPILKIWPKRAPIMAKVPLTLKEMCELYETARPKKSR